MISENRADEKRQVIADEAWRTVQEEGEQNERLLRLSREILDLTKELHAARASATPSSRPRKSLMTSKTSGFTPPGGVASENDLAGARGKAAT